MGTPMPNSLKVWRDFSFPFFFETDVNQKYPLPISQKFRERANPLASSFRAERTMHFFPSPFSQRPTAAVFIPNTTSIQIP